MDILSRDTTDKKNTNLHPGIVYLIGAGPGDAGLLTLRAAELLQTADVVLYDSLVGDAILSLMPQDCRKIAVGKRAGHHMVPQEETNRLLLEEAQKGNRVVRLKGGDPFLFGRGGEELELLAEHQIPFEIVPGVTSSIAVPAYNGIPVTHRDWASSVHIITAHRRADSRMPGTLDFPALAKMEGTLVFLMGLRALQDICEGLIGAGKDPETPAAVLERGTTAAQRRVTATLGTLPEESRRAGIGMPAIIVVGEVCRLADTFAWAEKRLLSGEKILLMRPRHLIRDFAAALRAKGAEVLEVPLIETRVIPENRRLDTALDALEQYQWLVFTSPTGVRLFFEALKDRKKDLRALGSIRIAVIGEGSRRELEKHGIFADFMPETYTGEALGAELSQYLEMQGAPKGESGTRILIPRAKEGNPELPRLLSAYAADDIPLYETVGIKPEVPDLRQLIESGEITLAVFTSASMVRAFAAAAEGTDLRTIRAACIGKQTAAAAEKAGMQVFVSEHATLESLEELITQMHAER